MPTLLRTNKEIMEIYDRQVDTVYRVCYAYMKNAPEAEDMTQETFLRLMSNGKPFADQRHEKAWLIITASNLCKDTLKKWWRKNENIDITRPCHMIERRRETTCWTPFWRCPRTTRTSSICTTTRDTPLRKLLPIRTVRKAPSAAACPGQESNL